MKKHLAKLWLLIPLVLIATATFAAYSYVAPTAAPTAANTDGPLDVGSTDQVKDGGLSVGTFNAQGNAYFDQNASYRGIIRSGSPSVPGNNVEFGADATPANVSITGNLGGAYIYSQNLAGTGTRPLCGDSSGKLYVCGQ